MLNILTFSTLYPNAVEPHHGIFTETSLRQQLRLHPMRAVVVAPVPWFPSTAGLFGRYARYARVPLEEVRNGVHVLHPRYANVPRIGMYMTPWTLYHAARRAIDGLLAQGGDFDVIDAHYFYPDGVAAAMLGRHYGKPVVISALGSDITQLPGHAWPRRLIRQAAHAAYAMISVCEALRQDMIRLGLPGERIHALRNAMIPVITPIGLQVGVMLAGAILTETIFSWPGIGKWMVDSVFRRDYPVIQGGLLLIAGIIMVVNLIVDLLYGLINPRIRH